MRQHGGLFRFRCVFFLAVCCFLLLFDSTSVLAQTYVHTSRLSFTWDSASGEVAHYNVYLSVEGQPYGLITEVPITSCVLDAADGKSYVVQVEAEDGPGNTGPISDPSEKVVVFLNGSQDDTDGDGMPNSWEASCGLNPFDPADGSQDTDGDGLVNSEEYAAGTLPTESDTDGDGVSDGAELMAQQNPLDPADNVPVANAGQDQESDPTVIELDGSRSFDPNGDPLTYSWSQVGGSQTTLSDIHAIRPTFVGTKSGTYGFELIVNDGRIDSYPDEVLITIRNVPPTADAGPDRVVDAGNQVVLDGSASKDANGDPILFAWTQIEGPLAALQGADEEKASFLPEVSGVYRFQLVVFDGELYSSPDDVQVVVNDLNRVPTADAGEDQTVFVTSTVTLDGSGSTDPENDPLEYLWSQLEGPEQVVLQGASTSLACFTPKQVGSYRFQLVVNDGVDSSPPDYVTVTAMNENHAPVAVTAGTTVAEIGNPVTLDGRGSYDPDGDSLTYQWTQTGGVQVTLEGADKAVANFHAFSEGVFVFQLVVSDGELTSNPALIEATVNGENQIPIADAGNTTKGPPGQEICLDGSMSYDPDPSDTLTYLWSQSAGPLVTLYGHDTPQPCFVPAVTGDYTFTLIVSDGKNTSAPDHVTVTVENEDQAPVAVCGNGLCEAGDGEDCRNCSADCNAKMNGPPDERFCCGVTEGCGDSRCNGGGWSCTTVPQGTAYCCAGDADCDDGLFCNGAETCDPVLDCQAGTDPCAPGDVCLEDSDTCCTPSTEICNDAVDNDCDGRTDCHDTDCTGDPACPSTVCGNGVCEGNGEDGFSCPEDCRCAGPNCVKACCGDGICVNENASNCPVDCGG